MRTIRTILEQIEGIHWPVLDQVAVRSVDGHTVRNDHVAFTLGGHHAVHAFIPEGEIWIENGVQGDDWAATLCHEHVERTLMRCLGWPYDRAHAVSNAVEALIREDMQRTS